MLNSSERRVGLEVVLLSEQRDIDLLEKKSLRQGRCLLYVALGYMEMLGCGEHEVSAMPASWAETHRSGGTGNVR